jgi:hypothetical protein
VNLYRGGADLEEVASESVKVWQHSEEERRQRRSFGSDFTQFMIASQGQSTLFVCLIQFIHCSSEEILEFVQIQAPITDQHPTDSRYLGMRV